MTHCFLFNQTPEGFGFNVMGGMEQKCPIYISRIIAGGYADRYMHAYNIYITLGYSVQDSFSIQCICPSFDIFMYMDTPADIVLHTYLHVNTVM